MKLIELWSEDNLAPKELGGSLAPIGVRGALIKYILMNACVSTPPISTPIFRAVTIM